MLGDAGSVNEASLVSGRSMMCDRCAVHDVSIGRDIGTVYKTDMENYIGRVSDNG